MSFTMVHSSQLRDYSSQDIYIQHELPILDYKLHKHCKNKDKISAHRMQLSQQMRQKLEFLTKQIYLWYDNKNGA
jgi:hypothetical protein